MPQKRHVNLKIGFTHTGLFHEGTQCANSEIFVSVNWNRQDFRKDWMRVNMVTTAYAN